MQPFTETPEEGKSLHLKQNEVAWTCKNYKKKCCKKYKKGDQCRRCPKLAMFDRLIDQYYLASNASDLL